MSNDENILLCDSCYKVLGYKHNNPYLKDDDKDLCLNCYFNKNEKHLSYYRLRELSRPPFEDFNSPAGMMIPGHLKPKLKSDENLKSSSISQIKGKIKSFLETLNF